MTQSKESQQKDTKDQAAMSKGVQEVASSKETNKVADAIKKQEPKPATPKK